MAEKKYKAAVYLRLSKEDGDKEESYSISNQRDLALDYISRHDDIELAAELADDGYTGSNFNRPAFRELIDKISAGEVDCVIVKDLSRFARDYIGTGYYLEKLFPSLGVRFISINDNIDSIEDNSSNARLVMAFKNVLNDSYIHDISVKIRSQFEIKRKKGEFIGAFAVFGYRKSPEDKHKLCIDEGAAKVVRYIFDQRMRGISASAIADQLNLSDVPSPAEYKKLCGSNFAANLQKYPKSKWTAKAVIRILTNEVYTGTLIQGKSTIVNYKVKKVIQKDRSEWSIIKNAHEPIIDLEQFEAVQEILKRDTRACPGRKEPYLFSGFLVCADCGASMVRRTCMYNKKRYAYYMCSTNKERLGCSSHRASEKALNTAVIKTVNAYCQNAAELSDKLANIPTELIKERDIEHIENVIGDKYREISDLERTISVVNKRCADELETKEECDDICADIRSQIRGLEKDIERLREEKAQSADEYKKNTQWLRMFAEQGTVKELDRVMLAHLIDKICIYEDKRISIKFRYRDKYEQLLTLVGQSDNMGGEQSGPQK